MWWCEYFELCHPVHAGMQLHTVLRLDLSRSALWGVKEENMNIQGPTDFIHQDQQGAKGSVWGYGAWWIRSDTGSSSLLFLRSALQRLERGSRFQPSTAALLCQNTATSTSAGVTWDANMCRCLGLSLTWTLNLLSNIRSSLCLFIIYSWVVYTKMNILSIFTLHWNHERLLNENDSHLCPWKKEGNACLEWHECEEMMTYL